MSFNLHAFVRDLCSTRGIPAKHVSAVVHRAEMAQIARDHLGKFTPLVGGGPRIVVVASLDGVTGEIEASLRALCRRVVEQASKDYQKGTLEQRV